MKHIEEATLREWMDLDVDGALDAPQKAQLTERLRADSELADERGSLESLHQLLAESRIAVEPGCPLERLGDLLGEVGTAEAVDVGG